MSRGNKGIRETHEETGISDMERMSELFKPKEYLDVRQHNNAECLKCSSVEKTMITIGAFIMCNSCKVTEFGEGNITYDSDAYKITYSKWLKVYSSL